MRDVFAFLIECIAIFTLASALYLLVMTVALRVDRAREARRELRARQERRHGTG